MVYIYACKKKKRKLLGFDNGTRGLMAEIAEWIFNATNKKNGMFTLDAEKMQINQRTNE